MANPDGLPQTDTTGNADTNSDIVSEAVARYQLCIDNENRDEAMEDLRFLKGDQWDAEAVRQRELDNRPCLTFNNLPAIIHQVTNDVRQNKQSIQVSPVDGDADPEIAEILEGLIRHIEYDSGADSAYDTALDGAATIGFGFWRLVTEYCDEKSFDQDIKFKRIRNPFTVHIDPNAQEADSSDMQFAFISTRMPRAEFEREYPNASATTCAIGTATGDNDNWMYPDFVRVVEYYRIEETADTLVELVDGSTLLKSDLGFKSVPESKVRRTRPTTTRKTMLYKLTGAEVLESTEIPCKWIPLFAVYGDEIDIDGDVTRNGLIRHAKSPKQMENFWLTGATEEVALRTKTPFIGAIGQFQNVEDDWNAANVRNFSYLEYNPVTVEGNLVGAPQRQPPADVPTGYIQMANMATQAVKAVTSIYDASLGNRSNETSGLAIRARQQQGDVANFHFSDNLQRCIIHCGRCMINMIPKIYDAPRVIRTLDVGSKQASPVAVNQPQTQIDPKTGAAVQTILNDLTVGTYDVVVTTGPAYNTQRQETLANMIELGGKWPKLMDVAGDKVIAAMDWPGAQEIAERIAKTLPPGLADSGDDQENMVQTPKGPIPAQQAGTLIGQLDQQLQEMHQQMTELSSGITKARIDAESRENVAKINAASKHDDTELAGMVQLILARQQASIDQFAAFADNNRPMAQADRDAAHFDVLAQGALADQSAGHSAALADQSVQHAAALNQQSADLAPPPAQQGQQP